MKIVKIVSHVLRHDLPAELGYSQQYYAKRTAHLVEARTDEGIVGWGECFGPGDVALANKAIVERTIAPLVVGKNPLDREPIWHNVYNLLRDHGQKGMPLQALSGVDIALWDIAGKALGQPLWRMLGGRFWDRSPVYGYGMMLRRGKTAAQLGEIFAEEARALRADGYRALKMKVGLGAKADARLVQSVRAAVGDDCRLMVDANHCYHVADAFYVGKALEELGCYWFEEPVAPEDWEGYRELRAGLSVNIAGGEAEFSRWGWRRLLENRCLDIAQPEACGLGGISEYMKVLSLAHAHFTPVVNHVWGSAVAVAVNLHLLAAMPPLPGGLFPDQPMLEFDTTENLFRDELPRAPLEIQRQVAESGGFAAPPDAPGHGVEPDPDFIRRHSVDA